MRIKFRLILFFIPTMLFVSCNVFSPDYEIFENAFSPDNNKTIEGLMKNFIYSYTFKDSFLYEEILDDDFVFQYESEGVFGSWTKDEDVIITNRMFRSFRKIDLVFNTEFPQHTSMPDTTVFTSFRISFYSGEEVINLTGYSKFIFRKYSENETIYKMIFWEDLK
ncbi:MAG: hypothetical protein JXN63_06570 [Candidatus Delongbacteria bacterium]|nr:hypothetical protein [Candidatus Delongbacteria bacterium]